MTEKLSFELFLNVHCVECGRPVKVAYDIAIAVCMTCSTVRRKEVVQLIQCGVYKPRNYFRENLLAKIEERQSK